MGVDGIIFWSSSKNMSSKCKFIQTAMNTQIGQVVKNITEAHEKCRREMCNSNGRCISLHNTTYVDEEQKSVNSSINDHLTVAEYNITYRTSDQFNGLGVIDLEEWQPLWDQNGYNLKRNSSVHDRLTVAEYNTTYKPALYSEDLVLLLEEWRPLSDQNGYNLKRAVLREAQKISKNYDSSLAIYAHTKLEYDPLKKINDFYNKVD
ncbi:hyaluronoglucosaminidase [Oesophagostomum dentatum]|uniref:Hyaluronidase n=1 Tax=Oesophagostomum dentatum TaxID=61180 RepID=A0A0B1TD77_OESDE|nr:hyaluronoglucosaminidase [Oesophagostomum dentatum]